MNSPSPNSEEQAMVGNEITARETTVTPSKISVNLLPTVSPPVGAVVPVSSPISNAAATSRRRCSDPKYDHTWTRHHALCVMAVAGDLILGGYERAHQVAEPIKVLKLTGLPHILLQVCPWILDARYLNLTGSRNLADWGLEETFLKWGTDRVSYFYGSGKREHPACLQWCKTRLVYREFYDTFSKHIAARVVITKTEAETFWVSVSDRVPLRSAPCASKVKTDGEPGSNNEMEAPPTYQHTPNDSEEVL